MKENNQKIIEFQNSFLNLDFGTIVTTADYQTIDVTVDPAFMMGGYARAVDRDLQRRNPVRYDSIVKNLSKWIEPEKLSKLKFNDLSDVIEIYIIGLCKIRLQAIHDKCTVWRQAKQLGIPPYVQFALSMIGIVVDKTHGRKFVPQIEGQDDVDLNLLLQISEVLSVFESDGVVLLKDAFPRSKEGDQDAMSYAIIDGYVKGIERNTIAKSYVAVFLGLKLRQETDLKSLYSIRYDNAEYVKDCLISELSKW